MNEQDERDDQRQEREGEPPVAGDPARLATEAVGEEDSRTVQKNQEPEEERPFGERLAVWLRRDAPASTRDSKATEKTRGLVLLGVTAVGGFFLFFGLFTTDSHSTKTARSNGPSLGRPQQQAVNPETSNRSAVPQLSVNPPANEETGDLTEKDVLGTMRNRGGTPLETAPAPPVAPKAPPPVNLGQINFDDPALAEAYRQGRVSPKRPPEVADWKQGGAQQQANQRPSAPAAPPAVPVVNNGESLRKSSLVFVRNSLGIPAPGVGVKPALERKATGLLPQGSVLVARLQHAVSSAAKVPVVAVIEYNYEQDGELIVPAGSKAYGELSQATPPGWVGIKFHTLEFPSGEKEEITGSALSMERGVLRGDVNGKNSGKKFLTRALTGMGTIAAYAVGGRGLGGSSINGIDSSILLRERLASNIAMAGEQEMAMLAYQQNIVVTVPANTRFYLVLHEAGVAHPGGQRDSVVPNRRVGASGAVLQQAGPQELLSTDEIRDLRQLRNEMRQMNQMLLNSQPLSPRPEGQ